MGVHEVTAHGNAGQHRLVLCGLACVWLPSCASGHRHMRSGKERWDNCKSLRCSHEHTKGPSTTASFLPRCIACSSCLSHCALEVGWEPAEGKSPPWDVIFYHDLKPQFR